MQTLQPGTSVLARRHRWRVVDARSYDDCQLVRLVGLGPSNAGREARLLMPFDTVEPIPSVGRLQLVRPRRWRRACRDLLAGSFSEEHLCAAGRARIDLLPHQLEPALAIVRGEGCRLLLADEVGLGKTVQAGLVIAELRARDAVDRILIVTPAGLREQWAEELSQRFDIHADVVDFHGVARRVSALPSGVNPWTTWPIAIVSVDYLKRAEVLPAIAACRWDAIIVDEAHGVATDSERHESIAGLAARAAYVIMLTATPHSGDARAFRSLCAIGGHRDRLMVFRRTRTDVQSAAHRHVHRLLLRPGDDERRMHALLDDFGRAVRTERGEDSRDMWLALAVLHKRAFSGAHALYQTVARRLAFIDAGLEGADEGEQLALPFENRGETDAADVAPPWQPALRLRDPAAERRLLVGLGAAASSAAAHETKLSALSRLLRRIAEPVIVFTEFRDTLMHVARRLGRPALVLHGGLSRQERSSVLRAFAADSRAILLATDAAGEGLNLQRACRVVINLELPWNPMRLEQRIGRVDRIGQLRTVHVFHLVAAGTGEQRLLRDLGERISRARHDIGAPNPLGDWNIPGDGDADRAARLVVGAPIAPSDTSLGRPRGEWPGVDLMPDCLDGGVEAHRLRAERALADVRNGTLSPRASESDTLATMARKTSTRLRLGATVLLIWEVLLEDGCGRHVCSEMTGTAVTLTRHLSRPLDRMSIERLLASTTAGARDLVEAGTAQRLASIRATVSSFITTRQVRERLIASAPPLAAYQPGLFDGRASHARAAQRDAHQQIVAATGQQLAILERRSVIRMSPPQLRLVLFP